MDEEFLEENHKQIPNLQLTQLVYRCEISSDAAAKEELKQLIIASIEEDQMLPFYEHLCVKLSWEVDTALVQRLTTANEEELSKVEEQYRAATESAGDTEVQDAKMAKARMYSRIGAKELAYTAYDDILTKDKISTGKKIDIHMDKARVALFWMDTENLKDFINSAKKLNDHGGDWDRRNRLKVYEAILLLIQRNVRKAAELLLDCVATFTCVEVCPYQQFMFYVVITNIMTLGRADLKKKILSSPQVISIMRRIEHIPALLNSLYQCNYGEFFVAMLSVHPMITADRYLGPHSSYIIREYRVLAYSQFLDAYKSVMLSSMARAFGVSVPFLDAELARFIAAGRLTAKIDKVGDVVETNRPDKKNAQYQDVIRKGDNLLNKIQKLARVVNA